MYILVLMLLIESGIGSCYLLVECTFECLFAGEQGFPNDGAQIAFVSNLASKLMPPSFCILKRHICSRFVSTPFLDQET